jgi:DNA mismatch endonuclease (patch repair protein)
MDTVDEKTRSRIMASVGRKDTGPEILLRSALHKAGFRYRLHDGDLPGRPDLVFPRFRAVVFVHGCFWHSHGCSRSTVPKSRREYWQAKFETNRTRDERSVELLKERGWRALVVWECTLVGKHAVPTNEIVERIRVWLTGDDEFHQIPDCPLA